MKEKTITTLCSILMLVPWSIFILRQNAWALESPTAEIMIGAYCVIMILSGIITLFSYQKAQVHNGLMKICCIVNSLYAVVGIAFFVMMFTQK